MKLHDLSIQTKVLVALAVAFTLLLAASSWFSVKSQHQLTLDLAVQKVDDVANAYFDGVNTMMLTGTTSQRGILRDKLLNQPGIMDVRILRSEAVVNTFGPGNPEQAPVTADDKKAMGGERLLEYGNNEKGRTVSLLWPVKASKDYRGTNCLNCHVVPEGSVLGVVKVSYSLEALDTRINNGLMYGAGINLVLFVLSAALIVWVLRRFIITPICQMRDAMDEIHMNSDLSRRLHSAGNDEIGRMALAFNNMLKKFDGSLRKVSDTTRQLSGSAGEIAAVSEQTTQAAMSQRSETDSVATAIAELEASAQDVKTSAERTAEASVAADQEANHGAVMTNEAIQGIHALITEIDKVAGVIEQLDERSQGVGGVLDVIRGIAEQTNLLALNAAIEAARAGEMGRGFAVVADEVRTLATRSHESTREIQEMIEQLQEQARGAVSAMSHARESAGQRSQQVEAAAESLNSIVNRVTEIRSLNTQMANAAQEQSSVTGDVSRNVINISEIAERTAEDAEKTSGISSDLVNLSAELSRLVDNFRLSKE